MGAPTAHEQLIYDSLVKEHQCRITMTVDYKAWTQDFVEMFGADVTKAKWQWSPGAKPLIAGGVAVFSGYGVPCFEWMRTRDDAFPEDPSVPFRARVVARFRQADPVYTVGYVIGAVDGEFGPASDLRVTQIGAVDALGFPSDVGNTLVHGPANILTPDAGSALAFDDTFHTVEVEWDPGNSPQYRILLDSVEYFTSDDAPRPTYIAIGYPTFAEAYIPETDPPEPYVAPGLADAPVTLIEVTEVTVESLDGHAYESVIFPDWTTAGGTDIDSAEGARFTLGGRTCAKIFMGNVISARVTKSKSSEFDTFAITLGMPKTSDPDGYANLYAGTRWDCEPCVLIDTRVLDDDGEATAWRRQIAGRVWKAHIEYGEGGNPHLQLSGPCIALAQLYSDASMAFIESEETLPGIYTNLTFTEVFEEMLDAAADTDGHEWAPTHDINAPDITPNAVGTGGQTLLQNFNDWADRLAQARYVKYATSGAAEFGQVFLHLQTIGDGSGIYGFRGLGSAVSDFPVSGASRDDDRRSAPGQVQFHPNTTKAGWLDIATYGMAGVFVYPAWPYPANTSTWSDSVPYTTLGMGSLIAAFPDKTATNQFGGIGKHRLRNETVRAQAYGLNLIGIDHIEPDDEVDFNDPDGTGYVGSIVVDRVEIEYADQKLTTRVTGFATDPTTIMLRRR